MAFQIKTLVSNFLQQNNDWKIVLLRDWPLIMGTIALHASLEKIDHDTLILAVEDACWLHELYMLSPLILKTINQKLDQPRIKRLRFKQATVMQKKEKPAVPQSRHHHSTLYLSSQERRALAAIKDPDLQKVLEHFLQRCHREKA